MSSHHFLSATDISFAVAVESPEQTQALGRRIGEIAGPNTVIALIGDLGAGKTCLVQGLAIGLGVPEQHYITSPTFTLINEYPGRLMIYHADLYRLGGVEDLEQIGFFDLLKNGGVVAIEWADKLSPADLDDYLLILLEETDDPDQWRRRHITIAGKGLSPCKLVEQLQPTV